MYTKVIINMRFAILFILLCLTNGCALKETQATDEADPSPSTYIVQEETDENQFTDNAGNPFSELIFDEYEGLIYKGADYEKYYKTEMAGISYLISKSTYKEQECIEKIHYIDSMLDKVGKWYGALLFDRLTVYLGDKITTHRAGDALYLNSKELSALETLVAIIKNENWEYANYGLCYGISTLIGDELGFDIPEPEILERSLSEYYSINENLILLDFHEPVFETVYFSEEDNKYARSSAYYFARFIEERYGMEELLLMIDKSAVLDAEFDEVYTDRCNEWLAWINASCTREKPGLLMRCRKYYGYEKYNYIYQTKHMKSHVAEGFYDKNADITFNYQEIIEMLSIGEQELDMIDKYLSPYFEVDLEPIDCYYINALKAKNSNNQFCINDGTLYIIYLTPYTAFTHEYVHYIAYMTKGEDYPMLWMGEGFPTYITYYYVSSELSRRSDIKNYLLVDEDLLITYLGNPGQAGSELELSGYCDLVAYLQYKNELERRELYYLASAYYKEQAGNFMSYHEAASMINYLITTYGDDVFISVFKNDLTLMESYGKEFDQLYEEFVTYLCNKFDLS